VTELLVVIVVGLVVIAAAALEMRDTLAG